MKKTLNILFSICFSLVIILGAIKFTVGFKELYYFEIDYLDIPASTNLSKEEIKLNYDYLIDYNLSKEVEEFEMPTIKSSLQGKVHFEEVRDIFQGINKIFNVCFVISIIGIFFNIRDKNIEFLNITSKALIGIPIALAIPLIVNFEKSFIIFHELLFDNDYWIFDPRLDPVINMLPEQFFFHAGMLILLIILTSSVIIYSIYRLLRIKREQ